MTITLQLEDPLAERLQSQANAKKVSVESCAKEVLEVALEPTAEWKSWSQVNSRRFALIRKRSQSGLDGTEAEELDQLQSHVAALLEPADRRMLDKLAEVEKKVGIDGGN